MARFYRVVHDENPGLDDFRSPAERGEAPRGRLTMLQWEGWRAASMFSTLEAAESLSRRAPARGAWIAVVDLLEDGSVRWAQQGRSRDHYNVWAPAETLRRCVVRVVRVGAH